MIENCRQLTCKDCGSVKPEKMFYKTNKSRCKECVKKRARDHRSANLEKYRAYDRKRSSQKDRIDAREAYARSTKGKLKLLAAKTAWAERNKDKRKAHVITGNAIRDGRLIKQPCEVCGTTESIEAHHDDYSKPLDIRWLCTRHHADHHKQERVKLRETGT